MAAYQKIGISVHELNASCPGYQAQAKAHSESVRSGCNTLEKSPGLPVAGALSPAVNFFSLVRSILDCDLVRVLEREYICIYVYVYMYICIYIYYICIYVYMYICIRVYREIQGFEPRVSKETHYRGKRDPL